MQDSMSKLEKADYDEQPTDCQLLMNLFKKMQFSSYSTAYSGVDSPGTAYMMLRAAAANELGEVHNCGSPEHVHAIDPWLFVREDLVCVFILLFMLMYLWLVL